MLKEHFDRVARRHNHAMKVYAMRVPAPCAPSSPSALYFFDLSHFLAANPNPLRWALAPKSDDGRGAARCRASVDVKFPENHARGGTSEVQWLANLLYLYDKSFDIVVDTFASGETVS
jgi:hypothetical protein